MDFNNFQKRFYGFFWVIEKCSICNKITLKEYMMEKTKLIFDYLRALTNLYGIVPKDKVVEIFNMQNNDKIDAIDIDNAVLKKTLDNEIFQYYKGCFVEESIMYDDSFHYLLKLQENKPYYIPAKSQLLRYKDDFYYERTKEFRNLKAFLEKNLRLDDIKAEELAEDIQFVCQTEFRLEDIFFEFERRGISFDSEDQVQQILNLVMPLSNNTRIWSNRGHTPNEIEGIVNKTNMHIIRKKERIGRNDPCPCGSGKKYKKCCLGKD